MYNDNHNDICDDNTNDSKNNINNNNNNDKNNFDLSLSSLKPDDWSDQKKKAIANIWKT